MSLILKIGVVGQDISYSKSQDIFHAIAQITSTDIRCEVFSVRHEGLNDLLERVRGAEIDGLSVTIPYKTTVMSLLDELDAEAASIGAANSICCRDNRLHGFNTDSAGFVNSLAACDESLNGARVMILGNGGAASAVVHALYHHFEVTQFVIVGRDWHRLEKFRVRFGSIFIGAQFALSNYQDIAAVGPVDVVVNCTPVGGANDPEGNPLPEGLDVKRISFYYDLNYNSGNRVVAMMRDHGVKATDGSRMLVAQAVRSYAIWTGNRVDPDSVYPAVFGGRGSQAGK